MNTTTDAAPARPRAPWKPDCALAAVLAACAALATFALFPYLFDTMPGLRAKIHAPMAVFIATQCAQAAVLVGVLALLGLRMAPRARLELPWLRALLARRAVPTFPWRLAVGAGLAAGALVIVASLLIDPHLPAPLHPGAATAAATSAWHGLLASFYGGIVEEVELRLFAMTLLVWVVAKLRRDAPGDGAYWFGVIGAALVFGVGHLPAAAAIWPLDAVVVVRVVLLNAFAGIAFGWLYWKRGLEVAMVAHFSADLVLHVLGPLLAPGLA
jgi:hypothetical protein